MTHKNLADVCREACYGCCLARRRGTYESYNILLFHMEVPSMSLFQRMRSFLSMRPFKPVLG